MTAGIENWRLGEHETTQRLTAGRARRGEESLVPGVVTIVYLGEAGEPLGSVSREALLPVATEEIRTQLDGSKMRMTFPVCGRADGEEFLERATYFTADPDEWRHASLDERRRAVESAGPVPHVALIARLTPLPEPKPASGRSGRRRIEYGDGRSAIVTDGEAKQIEFDDGETVTVTELPEDGAGDVSQKPRPRYAVPSRFSLEIFDKDGMRVTRYGRHRPCDGLPEVL